MKNYAIEDITLSVKRLVGDGSVRGVEGFELPDYALTVDELVKRLCEASCEQVLLEAPISMLDKAADFSNSAVSYEPLSVYDPEKYAAVVTLPEDYLRLVSFKMESWQGRMPLQVAYGSTAYNRLRSRWNAGHGSVDRPCISIVPSASNTQELEAYSCATGEAVAQALYAPRPHLQGSSIALFESLYLPSVYRIASNMLATSGEASLSAYYEGESRKLMGYRTPAVTTPQNETSE